jgi:cytochrome oxidase Cu insertion factor (SCO1/SenC/PrrC family)
MKRLRGAAWRTSAVFILALAVLRVQPVVSARQGDSVAPPAAAYGSALPRIPAPDFTLTGLSGRPLGLTDTRGHVVLLTFIDLRSATAVDTARLLRTFSEEIGPPARQVWILAVNTDPAATPAQLAAWTAARDMTGRWRWLTGRAAALQLVWTDYHIGSELDGDQLVHASATYILDPHGRERWVLSTAAASGLAAEAHALAAAVLALGG